MFGGDVWFIFDVEELVELMLGLRTIWASSGSSIFDS